jgi:hypothetical protein
MLSIYLLTAPPRSLGKHFGTGHYIARRHEHVVLLWPGVAGKSHDAIRCRPQANYMPPSKSRLRVIEYSPGKDHLPLSQLLNCIYHGVIGTKVRQLFSLCPCEWGL